MLTPNEVVVPTARAVAARALILHHGIERVAITSASSLVSTFCSYASEEERRGIATGMASDVDELVTVTIDVLKGLGLWRQLTPRERRLFESAPDDLTPSDLARAAREADALVVLLWALGAVDALPGADAPAEGSALLSHLAEPDAESVQAFLLGAALRPAWEIDAARDATAATRHELATGRPHEPELAAVVATRLKALDWLCGSLALREWDDAAPVER